MISLLKRSCLVKIVAIIINLTFIMPHMTWAFEAGLYPATQLDFLQIKHDNKVMTIPRKHGLVTQGYQGKEKTVVLITDLHCNYEVQKNIAAIIQHLEKNHQLRSFSASLTSSRL